MNRLLIAKGHDELSLLSKMANRHGLIAGATGTGKTVTLRLLAEEFSRSGVPVFLADIKGDLSGIARAGGDHPKVLERAAALNLVDYVPEAFPVVFWDLYGETGHPVRTTISEMGPLLLSRLFNLNETQAGVLSLVFRIADDQGLLLLDLKDLQAMVRHVGDRAAEFRTTYGNISAASIGAIQRSLLTLEEAGGDRFFGEPALDLDDLLQTDSDGRGVINILNANRLMQNPKLYATFLLWLLAELFERLPEAGDPERPRLVFFFDEAHLLFDNPPPALLDKIEQVVRLIRSKGVGVYFVSQNPLDIPEVILGQLGNRIQHALRAFTPRDQRAVRAAAETFRPRPGLDVATTIMELETGEALISLLDSKGAPTPVDRALVFPPRSRLSPLSTNEISEVMAASPLSGIYEKSIDRESAYEKLKARAEQEDQPEAETASRRPAAENPAGELLAAAAKSAAHAIGSSLGRQIIRGILGSIFGGGRRR